MTEWHHYTACGLDYVYLANGFTVHDTAYGKGVSIKHGEALDEAIARAVINAPSRLRGQEVRFLRAQLDASQGGLARILGTTRAAVARWEGKPHTPIPGAADRALRLFYALKAEGDAVARQMVDLMSEIDDAAHEREVFRATKTGWARAA